MWEQTVPALFCLSLAGGIVCGLVWDFLEIQRIAFGIVDFADEMGKYKRKSNFAFLFLHDVLFCVIFGCVIAVVMYYGNEGRMRILSPIGMLVGFWAYRRTLGARVIMGAEKLISLIRRAFRRIFAFVGKLATKLKRFVGKAVNIIKKKLPTRAARKNKEAV